MEYKETKEERESREFVENIMFGKPQLKPKRHMNRCYHCGKVTGHIFCDVCYKLPHNERTIYYKTKKVYDVNTES